jgi:hypothetical protein
MVGMDKRMTIKKRLIHKKRLNDITLVEFHGDDISIFQEESMVILDKAEIIELAQIIMNEEHDLQFYQDLKGRTH